MSLWNNLLIQFEASKKLFKLNFVQQFFTYNFICIILFKKDLKL